MSDSKFSWRLLLALITVAVIAAGGGWYAAESEPVNITVADVGNADRNVLDTQAYAEAGSWLHVARTNRDGRRRPGEALSVPDLVDEVNASVVNITAYRKARQSRSRGRSFEEDFFRKFFGPNQRGESDDGRSRQREQEVAGSGFIISDDGYILTNYHIVDKADRVEVYLQDRRKYDAEIVGIDASTDLALLKIESENHDFPAAVIGNSNHLRIGESVVAIGSPFGMDFSVTSGVVSAKGRAGGTGAIGNYVPFIQTDVAINPGNSGGPLFNMQGEVIGINSQIFTRTGGYMGISFSIPISVALHVVAQLKEHGYVQRGWLGVQVREVSALDAEALDLKRPMGAWVVDVVEDSPAEEAGLEIGDVIVNFAGQELLHSYELPPAVGIVLPGTEVDVDIVRNGRRMTIDVEVAELDTGGKRARRGIDEGDLGIAVTELTGEVQDQYNLDTGVLVTDVESDMAYLGGLRTGDIITIVNGVTIADQSHFWEVVDSIEDGRSMWMRFISVANRGAPVTLSIRKGQ